MSLLSGDRMVCSKCVTEHGLEGAQTPENSRMSVMVAYEVSGLFVLCEAHKAIVTFVPLASQVYDKLRGLAGTGPITKAGEN